MSLSFRAKVQWLDEKWLNIYFGPYFTGSRGGKERLYCGDSNGHIHFESFSSHISLTLRTPVLFIFGRLPGIGHGMKYIPNSLDKCPGRRRRRLQSFYLSTHERVRGRLLRTARRGHCADCKCNQTSTGAQRVASEVDEL